MEERDERGAENATGAQDLGAGTEEIITCPVCEGNGDMRGEPSHLPPNVCPMCDGEKTMAIRNGEFKRV